MLKVLDSIPSRVKGAFWKVASCGFFAATNGVVRHISNGENCMSSYEILFFQNIFGLLFLMPLFIKSGASFKTQQFGRYSLRAALAFMGVILWYMALKYMPLVQAVALNFLGPVFTILFARFFLGESLPQVRWIAILIGFTGAFIAGRPDVTLGALNVEQEWVIALPLLSAMCISGSLIVGKQLSYKEHPNTIAFYLLLLMTPLSFGLMLTNGSWPNLHHLGYLIALGAFTAGAHLSLNNALKHAEVTFLIPFGLARLIFSGLFGYFMFAEIPKNQVWVGAGIVLLGLSLMDYKPKSRSLGKA